MTDRPLTTSAVVELTDKLGADDYHSAVTTALGPSEARPFYRSGYTVRRRLALLERPIERRSRPRDRRLRRARRHERDALLAIDARSFPEEWRFDHQSLDDAVRATPMARFRTAHDGTVAGYAITGIAGTTSFLQRLAVDPDHQRRGIANALVDDAVWWAARRGAVTMLVNTAEDNDAALTFYEHLGFQRREDDLVVLQRALGGHD
ncbi:MAG: GNAT family N-acetyltransferase [Acidimicrobiia bacterium]|nr:GNAT family N-acetyltransferase [Acidimicrobiia bacterium]